MKPQFKTILIVSLLLSFVFSLLPVQSALAAGAYDPGTVKLTVRNHTGGTVSLRVSNADNGTFWFTVQADGPQQVSLPEGRYDYYASTPCGGQSGEFNLNLSKELNISCDEGLELTLGKRDQCEQVLWVGSAFNWYETNPEWWSYLLGEPFFEAEMRCFDETLDSVFTPFLPF